MSIDKQAAKRILLKSVSLEKGKEIALAKEFISIEDNTISLKDSIDTLAKKINEPIELELIIE